MTIDVYTMIFVQWIIRFQCLTGLMFGLSEWFPLMPRWVLCTSNCFLWGLDKQIMKQHTVKYTTLDWMKNWLQNLQQYLPLLWNFISLPYTGHHEPPQAGKEKNHLGPRHIKAITSNAQCISQKSARGILDIDSNDWGIQRYYFRTGRIQLSNRCFQK